MLRAPIMSLLRAMAPDAKLTAYCTNTGSLTLSGQCDKSRRSFRARSKWKLPPGYAWQSWTMRWDDIPHLMARSSTLGGPPAFWRKGPRLEGTQEERLIADSGECKLHTYRPEPSPRRKIDIFHDAELFLFDPETGERTTVPRRSCVLIPREMGVAIWALNSLVADHYDVMGCWWYDPNTGLFTASVAGEFIVSGPAERG